MWNNLNKLWKNVFTFYNEFDFTNNQNGNYLSEFSRVIIQNEKWYHSKKLTTAEINKVLSIQNLDLSGLGISDLKPITKFNKLKVLNLSNNNIKTILPLVNCKKLEFLDISNNSIKTIKHLNNLSRLKGIKIDDNLNFNELENNNPNCKISINFNESINDSINIMSPEEIFQHVINVQSEFESSSTNQELFRRANSIEIKENHIKQNGGSILDLGFAKNGNLLDKHKDEILLSFLSNKDSAPYVVMLQENKKVAYPIILKTYNRSVDIIITKIKHILKDYGFFNSMTEVIKLIKSNGINYNFNTVGDPFSSKSNFEEIVEICNFLRKEHPLIPITVKELNEMPLDSLINNAFIITKLNPDYPNLPSTNFIQNQSNSYDNIKRTANLNYLLFFDTETTGLPKNWKAPASDTNNWPRLIQFAWQLYDENGNLLESNSSIIKPDNFIIPREASKVHGITTEKAYVEGKDLELILDEFKKKMDKSNLLIAHNMSFDEKILGAEYYRLHNYNPLSETKKLCTMKLSTNICKIDGPYGYKWPKLEELHNFLFKRGFDSAHDAEADIQATADCYFEMKKRELIK
jgi:DNA polymerase III epsilon subunit-like protein